MRLYISLALATVLGTVVLTACNSKDRAGSSAASASPVANSTPSNPPNDGVRRITTAELQNLLAKNEAIVIDTRNEGSFKLGHIKGARLIPATEVLAHVDELPRDKMIVTYCSWPNEHTSAGAVINLKTKGIENAAALLGGFEAWKKAGLPVETVQ